MAPFPHQMGVYIQRGDACFCLEDDMISYQVTPPMLQPLGKWVRLKILWNQICDTPIHPFSSSSMDFQIVDHDQKRILQVVYVYV